MKILRLTCQTWKGKKQFYHTDIIPRNFRCPIDGENLAKHVLFRKKGQCSYHHTFLGYKFATNATICIDSMVCT